MKQRIGEMLFLVVVLAVVAGVCMPCTPAGLYSNEDGVQYVQMKNFALNGTLEIAGPGQRLGFEAGDVVGTRSYFEAKDGRLFATTPPLFPWIASLFIPLCGEKTVDFTPILFVFLSALVLAATLDRVMRRGVFYYFLLAAFLAGSPVFLQGLLFTGMAFALFLVVSALWLLVSHFSGIIPPRRNFSALLSSWAYRRSSGWNACSSPCLLVSVPRWSSRLKSE